MKRSEINRILTETIKFLDDSQFYLPEWAKWSWQDWFNNKERCQEIFARCLGWDVTDSGYNFATNGLILFTIRNGIQNTSRAYCEKIIVMQPGQVCPYHHHIHKTEDIINRSQHDIAFQIYHEKEPEASVTISVDSIQRTLKSKEPLILHSGQSLTLPPLYTHKFWPLKHVALIGEVSTVNDDNTDNVFCDNKTRRFPTIEEDEDILFPIVGDYKKLQSHS